MGTVKYGSALADSEALNASGSSATPVALVAYNRIEISPSELGSDGESFLTSMASESTGQSISSSGSGSGSDTQRPSEHGLGFGRNPDSAFGRQGGRNPFGGGMPDMGRGRR